jgi:tetratricopeptide (TPR) repeat protein
MDPNFGVAYTALGHVYQQKGMYKEAIAAVKKGIKLSGSLPLWTAVLGALYAAAGKKDEALKVIEELNEVSQQRYLPPMGMAICYMVLNKKELVFEWLEKAYQQRDGFLVYVNLYPVFDPLRSDPRFQSFLRRLNLPE